jgi:endo-1,4-beta-xylanase
MRQYTALGVDVEITELDVTLNPPFTQERLIAQGRAYFETVTACLSVPRCTGVTVWGLNDGDG